MHLVTPDELRDRVRQALDIKTGGGAVWQGEKHLDECLDQYLGELYDILLATYGMEYGYRTDNKNTVADQAWVSLAKDCYKVLRADVVFNDVRYPIEPFRMSDSVLHDASRKWTPGLCIRYRIAGLGSEQAGGGLPAFEHPRTLHHHMFFDPIPADVYSVKVYYAPAFPGVGKTRQFDDVNGWSWFAVYGAAADIAAKEERDPSFFLAKQEQYRARLAGVAGRRETAGPERVRDLKGVRRRRYYGGFQ